MMNTMTMMTVVPTTSCKQWNDAQYISSIRTYVKCQIHTVMASYSKNGAFCCKGNCIDKIHSGKNAPPFCIANICAVCTLHIVAMIMCHSIVAGWLHSPFCHFHFLVLFKPNLWNFTHLANLFPTGTHQIFYSWETRWCMDNINKLSANALLSRLSLNSNERFTFFRFKSRDSFILLTLIKKSFFFNLMMKICGIHDLFSKKCVNFVPDGVRN